MTKNKILVVGGYGSVGRVIATTLGKQFPGRVVAAGRNYHKAKQLSSATQQQVLPLALDIYMVRESELRDVAVVVTCIDQGDTQFVEQCHRIVQSTSFWNPKESSGKDISDYSVWLG